MKSIVIVSLYLVVIERVIFIYFNYFYILIDNYINKDIWVFDL